MEALKEITNTSNPMYSLGKCNEPQDIAKANKNVLRLKHAIVSYFVSPFDSDLRYSPNLYNIVSGTPVAEIVKDCMLLLKIQARN